MKKKIFIASSSEMIKEVAEPIAQALANNDLEPIRWWKAFPAGEYTLESLENSLSRADGGVFICGADDDGTSRGVDIKIPRDNVIFEIGYFLPKLGRLRCYILKSEGVKLPTDIRGITYENIIEDIHTYLKRLSLTSRKFLMNAISYLSKI